MTSLLARRAPFRPLTLLAWCVVPLTAAAGCGPGFVPEDGSDAASGGASSGGATADGEPSDAAGGGDDGENVTGGAATDGPESTGGRTGSGGTNSGGTSSTGGQDASGGQGGSGGSEDSYDCNPDHIVCLPIVAPEPCPPGEAYSVEGSCYGECVPIGQCECASAADCPDPNGTDEYACHGTTDRCGPWL